MIDVETPLPPFSLTDAQGLSVTGQDLLGRWWVLYFYPKDRTPGCTIEASEFSALLPQFAELGAEVIGVSPDSPESHRDFIDHSQLSVRLLSDPEHSLMEPVGAWGEKVLYGKRTTGVKRSTVIVDPQGIVRRRWAAARAAGHAGKVLEALKKLLAAPPK